MMIGHTYQSLLPVAMAWHSAGSVLFGIEAIIYKEASIALNYVSDIRHSSGTASRKESFTPLGVPSTVNAVGEFICQQ